MPPTDAEPHPRSELVPLPAWSPRIRESRALRPAGPAPTASFEDVLDRRRSDRAMFALSEARLSELLWHAVRARDVRGDWQHRAAASAGGLHPIQVLVFARATRDVVLYEPTHHHALVLDEIDSHLLCAALDQTLFLGEAADATLLLLAAEMNRTASAYENSKSLVWRDAGCLLATLQIVCSWLSIASCPLGVLGEPLLAACGASGQLVATGLLVVGEPAVAGSHR